MSFIPSRSSGLERLAWFVPNAGRAYAERRNYDYGPDRRENVSGLSPWLRHRLITEEDVLRAVLNQHTARSAEKFIQEVCWRTYWKGWLEMRPDVWTQYWNEVLDATASLGSFQRQQLEAAVSGQTGIDCFDDWCRELIRDGYLHNHARMWFASIWVFTLKLPWALGADFFLRHLLDGDAASNTLSWRWVAGLQTRGKSYLAREDNIATFTGQRYPQTPGLASEAPPLSESMSVTRQPLPAVLDAEARRRSAWLLLDDDLSLEQIDVTTPMLREAIALDTSAGRSPGVVSEQVCAFTTGALKDAASRLDVDATPLQATNDLAASLIHWCRERDVAQLVCAYPTVGPSRDVIARVSAALAGADIRLAFVQRDWDRAAWPYATKGFFPFKKHLPELLQRAGLAAV